MIDHREKLLSFDEFKEKVYKNIDFLETIDNNSTANAIKEVNTGCLGMLFNGLFVRFAAYANTILSTVIN